MLGGAAVGSVPALLLHVSQGPVPIRPCLLLSLDLFPLPCLWSGHGLALCVLFSVWVGDLVMRVREWRAPGLGRGFAGGGHLVVGHGACGRLVEETAWGGEVRVQTVACARGQPGASVLWPGRQKENLFVSQTE